MYRVAWKSKATGLEGRGEFLFASRELAVEGAAQQNKKYPGLKHWIESKEDIDWTIAHHSFYPNED